MSRRFDRDPLLLSPWRVFLMALPFRSVPKPDWGFYPGLRALLFYAWQNLRAHAGNRARLHYRVTRFLALWHISFSRRS